MSLKFWLKSQDLDLFSEFLEKKSELWDETRILNLINLRILTKKVRILTSMFENQTSSKLSTCGRDLLLWWTTHWYLRPFITSYSSRSTTQILSNDPACAQRSVNLLWDELLQRFHTSCPEGNCWLEAWRAYRWSGLYASVLYCFHCVAFMKACLKCEIVF